MTGVLSPRPSRMSSILSSSQIRLWPHRLRSVSTRTTHVSEAPARPADSPSKRATTILTLGAVETDHVSSASNCAASSRPR